MAVPYHEQAQLLAHQALSLVSHELKSPLVAITGALSTLRMLYGTLSEQDARALLQTAEQESHYLSNFIEAAICVANIRTIQTLQEREVVSLRVFASAQVARMQRAGLSLALRVQGAAADEALVNPDALATLMNWLCAYAFRKLGDDARIALSVAPGELCVLTEAEDNTGVMQNRWKEATNGLQDGGLKQEILTALCDAQGIKAVMGIRDLSWKFHFRG